MSPWLVIIILSLATHRVTRLVTRDEFPLIAVPRDAFVNRWGVFVNAPDKRVSIGKRPTNLVMRSVAYAMECDWCTGVWVSAVATFLTYRWTILGDEHWFIAVLAGLTATTVTGLIAQREPD